MKKLGEIATFSKGKGISKSEIEENGITECIRYGELYTHYREVINEIKSRTNVDKSALVLSEENDVIIPASGETTIDIATASCVLKPGIALGGDLNIIKSKNDGVFLSYYLNSKKKMEIANLAQGISVVHLYSSQLASLSLSLPTNQEQEKISTFLAKISERIDCSIKIIEGLEKLKVATAKKIFSQEFRFKDNNGNDFSKWEEMKLKNIVIIQMGQSPDSSSYNFENIGIPLIQGNADILNRKSNPRQYTSKPTKFCDVGDLLLTVRAPVGYVGKSKHYACIGRGICSVKNNDKSILEFIYQFLLYFEDKWKSIEQGSTFTAVNSSDINSINILLPSIPEQTKIANFLSAIDSKIDMENQLLQKLEEQKKFLLQNMFV